jgi:hypothetical protein
MRDGEILSAAHFQKRSPVHSVTFRVFHELRGYTHKAQPSEKPCSGGNYFRSASFLSVGNRWASLL